MSLSGGRADARGKGGRLRDHSQEKGAASGVTLKEGGEGARILRTGGDAGVPLRKWSRRCGHSPEGSDP